MSIQNLKENQLRKWQSKILFRSILNDNTTYPDFIMSIPFNSLSLLGVNFRRLNKILFKNNINTIFPKINQQTNFSLPLLNSDCYKLMKKHKNNLNSVSTFSINIFDL